jgi:hypothetical protein
VAQLFLVRCSDNVDTFSSSSCCPSRAYSQANLFPAMCMFRQLSSEASECGLRPWRDHQRRYIGWRSQRRAAHAKNRLLVFHGNADCAADRAYFVQGFEELGNGGFSARRVNARSSLRASRLGLASLLTLPGAFLVSPFDTFAKVVRIRIGIPIPPFLLPDRYDNGTRVSAIPRSARNTISG